MSALIKAKQDENRKFLAPEGDLGKAITEMQALEVGDTVRDEIVDGLRKIGERVERGGFGNMDDASDELVAREPERVDIKKVNMVFKQVKELADAEEQAGNEPKVKISDLKAKLNQATDLNTLNLEVNQALELYKPKPAGPQEDTSYALGAGVLSMEDFRKRREAEDVPAKWSAFTSGLHIQRLLGVAVTAAFALIGGVIALYVPNATWGASINDYITLLVWALSVNIIAGQTVDFKATLQPPAQA